MHFARQIHPSQARLKQGGVQTVLAEARFLVEVEGGRVQFGVLGSVVEGGV